MRPPSRHPAQHPVARFLEADQAGLGELLPDFGELAAAADEAGGFGGQIAWALGGPGHDICIRPLRLRWFGGHRPAGPRAGAGPPD
jgi:hypothetical protein